MFSENCGSNQMSNKTNNLAKQKKYIVITSAFVCSEQFFGEILIFCIVLAKIVR